MNIPKAIAHLEKLQIDDLPLPRHLEWQAVQLGIEALKRIKATRLVRKIGPVVLLPGETED